MRRLKGLVATVVLLAFGLAASAAHAAPVLQQGFEGGLNGWTATGLWHAQSQPQTVSVSPSINPSLVTLPDAGQLPAAKTGTSVAWYGEASSGTFCTGYTAVAQTDKNGCKSQAANTGTLTSPAFSLTGAQSAQMEFDAWWEIEAVDANVYDVMTVEYSTNGSTWTSAGKLNPVNNPNGEHDQSYSNEGL